jgi:predicted O-linked N-acetylglucosamine transferase (SPINDLY family)
MPAIADIRKPPDPASTKTLIALYESGRLLEAEALANELAHLHPSELLVWKILSAIQLANDQFDKALEASLRCLELSRGDAAVYNNVGIAHLGLGDLKAAAEAFDTALAIAPDYTKALSGLGNVHLKKREHPQAEALFRQVLNLDPTQEKAWLNLGHVCELRHKLTEAATCYERALKINPRNYLFISDLLQIVTHDASRDIDEVARLHRQYGSHFDQFATQLPPCSNDKSIDRPLVIGLVTSDLRDHALANYFEPMLQQFSDASNLTVHVYFGRTTEDAVTKRMRRYIQNWHAAYLWDDTTLAHHIRTHQIDILIDLNGHTEANRLAVFAMRPAPVQMTWLGYLGTTGMSSMDYYIADTTWLPNLEYSKYFTEHLALLPCATPFLPNNQSPSVNALPALTNGYITYGSFNRRIKLNDAVIDAWCTVMHATPKSRMVLGAINEPDQAEVTTAFAKSGISSDRLTFFGRMAQVDYLALHHQVDMCLDTFPFGGGATTAQAAWMGVPTVSLMGTSAAGRLGAAEMLHLGLDTFVAQSPAEFTSVAIYWAGHVKELADLRLTLRVRFLASPMGQYEQFAVNFKGLMRAAWKHWCDGLAPATLVLNDMPLETQSPLAISGTRPTPAALAQLWQLYDADQVAAAKQLATSILRNSPQHAQTLKLLGGLYRKSGDLELALATHRSIAALYPDDFEAHFNLANELSQQGQFDEAIKCFTAALAIDPLHAVTYNNMSTIFRTMELNAEAEMYARQAIQVEPSLAIAHNNLGNALQAQGKFSAAQASYEQALALRPEWAEAYNNLAICLKDQCLSFEANAAYEKVLTLKPQWAAAHSNYLYCLSLDVQTNSEKLHAAHVRFGEQHADALQTEWKAHTNRKDPKRTLKIGFVSADLYAHALTFFFEPWFRQLGQKSGLELHAYYTHFFDDDSTKRLRKHFAFWHAVNDLNEEELAQKIRSDEIDILFDLSGHTAHNRLLTFARKPAPIQVSYLGYLGTTGLKAVDYFLCDKFWIPPELGWQFTEKLAYLPSAIVFQPSPLAPNVNHLPALTNGFVTFGSFNRANKINDSVVALWSMLMKEVPTAKLLLGGVATDSHERIMRSFLNNGIALERIDFIQRSNLENYLAQYHLVDFCLDTYPFGGGATTAHGISMGVPTLSLAGDTPASRLGASEMHQLGLDSFIAYDVDEFIEKGRYWTSQLVALDRIRANMRQHLAESKLGDEIALGNATAEILRTMWVSWCNEDPVAERESSTASLTLDIAK